MMNHKEIWVIEERPNPSTEYYILPALKTLAIPEKNIKIFNSPPEERVNTPFTLIFVRYLNRKWINFVEKNSDKVLKIFYFMDDDLLDVRSWKNLPLKYLLKLYFNAYRWKGWLEKKKVIFLVSNNFLAKKYNYLNPLVLNPYPIFEDLISTSSVRNTNNKFITVFYHATYSHKEEIKWLYNIISEVLKLDKKIIFELVGDSKVYKKYKSLERVIIVHPMKWESYKKFLVIQKREIGLVPVLDIPFNLGRNYTKFFEIVACGAIGVYSQNSSFANIISHNKDGILLTNDKKVWIETILELANDQTLRANLYLNSLNKLSYLKKLAETSYKENLLRGM